MGFDPSVISTITDARQAIEYEIDTEEFGSQDIQYNGIFLCALADLNKYISTDKAKITRFQSSIRWVGKIELER